MQEQSLGFGENSVENLYFLFRLENDLFVSPLLAIREVLEPTEIRSIPHTVPAFRGLMNIRGSIVGVMDLGLHFDFKKGDGHHAALFLIDTDQLPLAILVDCILSVVEIPPEKINSDVGIISPVPQEYIAGVAQVEDQIVPIINLRKVLDLEALVAATASLKS